MTGSSDEARLAVVLELLLEVADGNYAARLEPSHAGDAVDAVAVGLNLMAESLELERDRRRRAEALLRDEVRAYEEAPAMFCSVRLRNFEIVKCNETMARALGVPKAALLQRRLLGYLPRHERPQAETSLRAIARGEVPEQTTFNLRGAGPSAIPVLISGSRADDDEGRFRLVLRDVSREHLLAAKLREAQKLEIVGRLASGVAHDFNNALQVIVGSALLLRGTLPAEHTGQRELDAIIDAADLGSALTRQLLALSRPLPEDRQTPVSDLRELVALCQPLLLRTLGPSNELVLESCDVELPVQVDPGELTQVLINLAINGRDAMPRAGVLTIRTSAESRGGEGFAVIEVLDSGEGIPPDLIADVMEPFVTTKADKGGTGLGLSVCRRIAEGWKGDLRLTSEVGIGTRVKISIPLGAIPREAAAPAVGAGRGTARVLVVDDEPLVRGFVARTLEQGGYEVLVADGMAMAVDVVRDSGRLDLMVTDVVMPGGSGVELAQRLWTDQPGLPVVFVSGYTGDEVDRRALERPNVRFLGKPFRPRQLLELLEELSVAAPATR